MNQRRSFIVLLAVALLLGAFVFSASAKGQVGARTVFQSPLPQSANVFLSNGPVTPVNLGGEFTFDVGLDVANVITGVAAAEVYIGYPVGSIAPVSSPGLPIAEILPDFFGTSSVSVNEITATCPNGAASCAHLVVAGPPQITKRGAIARYHFKPLIEGQICITLITAALADTDGYPVPNTLGTQVCITVVPSHTITGTVQRQGTPANPNAGGGTWMCSQVKASTGQSTLTTVSGSFTLAVPANVFSIEASYSGFLKAAKSFSLPSDGLAYSAGTVRLLGGDANGDGVINILDIGSVISEFGRTGLPVRSAVAGCAGADDPNDINDDGTVNIGDLAIAAGNWGKVGPIVWP
jgi:hypothetical protein